MGLMTKIEEAIAKPLEIFHTKKGFQPVDVCRLALKCMERGAKKGINKTYAPNLFRVSLNKTDYKEYKPFIDVISSDIKGELRRVIEERDYLLAGDLKVEIFEDNTLESGLPKIEGLMQGEDEPRSIITAGEKSDSMEESIEKNQDSENNKGKSSEMAGQENRETEYLQDEKTVLMMPESFDNKKASVTIINNVFGIFDTDMPGVKLHIGSEGLFLENRNLDRQVTVNGKVALETLIKNGDKLTIKGFKLKYREKKGSKS